MKRIGMLAALALTCVAGPASAASYAVIHNFLGGPDGANPLGRVAIDASGALYGTAVNGGANYEGSIWRLTPPATPGAAWTVAALYSFAGSPDGANPYGDLLIDKANGSLLGTTINGGATNAGTVFRLDPRHNGSTPWIFRHLHDFVAATDGSNPRAGLAHCGGAVCGIGTIGGANGLGTVFRLHPYSTGGRPYDFNVIWTFTGNDDGSSAPYAPVFSDARGTLIGTTTGYASGQGAVYQLQALPNQVHKPWQFSILHSFPFGSDGYVPAAAVKSDASGTLYGTTIGGGTNGGGTVYRLVPPTGDGTDWTETVLYSFSAGCAPTSALVIDAQGGLLGTTQNCGANGLGMVFRLAPQAGDVWQLTSLHDFAGGTDGQAPAAGLTRGPGGVYYGTSSGGNSGGPGTVYALTP